MHASVLGWALLPPVSRQGKHGIQWPEPNLACRARNQHTHTDSPSASFEYVLTFPGINSMYFRGKHRWKSKFIHCTRHTRPSKQYMLRCDCEPQEQAGPARYKPVLRLPRPHSGSSIAGTLA